MPTQIVRPVSAVPIFGYGQKMFSKPVARGAFSRTKERCAMVDPAAGDGVVLPAIFTLGKRS